MPLTAQNLFDSAGTLLLDATGVRWTSAELLRYLNEGQREVCVPRPDASVFTGNITLAAGVEQTLPSGGLRLIDITATAAGVPIRIVDRDKLDRQLPGWRALAQTAAIKHYMHDPLVPRAFQVYPPAANASVVKGSYTVAPTDCVNGSSTLGVDDIYGGALLDWMLFRAFSKNGKGADPVKAAGYRSAFYERLGVRTNADAAIVPGNAKQLQVRQNQGTK